MKAKEAVQVDHRFAGNADRRPHRIVSLLTMWHHNIETVSRATLENDHKALFPEAGSIGGECRPRQKSWDCGRADYSKGSVAKKNAACDGHIQLLASGYSLLANTCDCLATFAETRAIPTAVPRLCWSLQA